MARRLDQEEPLTALSLTHVVFNPSDRLSNVFAYITLAPIAILVAYVTTIMARREVAAILILIGQLACESFNAILKAWLKEKRPTDNLRDSYGMPSSHAQFMAFWATYSILYLYRRITFHSIFWKLNLTFGLISFSVAVSYSRIYLNYHTPKQVLVGNCFGLGFALAWFLFVEYIIRPSLAFSTVLNSPFAQFFYLRDSSEIPNVMKFEYLNSIAYLAEKNSSRKLD